MQQYISAIEAIAIVKITVLLSWLRLFLQIYLNFWSKFKVYRRGLYTRIAKVNSLE